MPDTRPGIKFNEGECIACTNYQKQKSINWKERKQELEKLCQGIINEFCNFANISIKEFWQIMDKWYNTDLFERDDDGVWHEKFKVGQN